MIKSQRESFLEKPVKEIFIPTFCPVGWTLSLWWKQREKSLIVLDVLKAFCSISAAL